MTSLKLFIELLFGFLTSIGFGILSNIPKRAIIPAGITGSISWGTYCMLGSYTHHILWQNLVATIIIGYLGSLFANKYKFPATMIYVPSIVALVPGGGAADGMKKFVEGQSSQAVSQIFLVILTSLAIAIGFIVGQTLYKLTKKYIVSFISCQ